MRPFRCIALLCVLAVAAGCARRAPRADTVEILAAASLVDLFHDLSPTLAQRHLHPLLTITASAEARAQIERGAPADLFVAADAADVDQLEREGLLVPGTRRTLFRNRLVLVTPADSHADLRTARRVGLGQPDTVPAGRYARQSLQRAGQWDAVRPRVVYGGNVRVVLGWVGKGEVDAAYVYATDAHAARTKVRVVAEVPDHLHDPIVYPGAVLRDARHPDNARAVLDVLSSPDGKRAAERLGFLPADVR